MLLPQPLGKLCYKYSNRQNYENFLFVENVLVMENIDSEQGKVEAGVVRLGQAG